MISFDGNRFEKWLKWIPHLSFLEKNTLIRVPMYLRHSTIYFHLLDSSLTPVIIYFENMFKFIFYYDVFLKSLNRVSGMSVTHSYARVIKRINSKLFHGEML